VHGVVHTAVKDIITFGTNAGIVTSYAGVFLAGNDLLECPIEPDRLAAVVAAMTQAVASGRISSARLRASVHHIIRLKGELGLMPVP